MAIATSRRVEGVTGPYVGFKVQGVWNLSLCFRARLGTKTEVSCYWLQGLRFWALGVAELVSGCGV